MIEHFNLYFRKLYSHTQLYLENPKFLYRYLRIDDISNRLEYFLIYLCNYVRTITRTKVQLSYRNDICDVFVVLAQQANTHSACNFYAFLTIHLKKSYNGTYKCINNKIIISIISTRCYSHAYISNVPFGSRRHKLACSASGDRKTSSTALNIAMKHTEKF